jgi:integrase
VAIVLTIEDMALAWCGPEPIGQLVKKHTQDSRRGYARHLVNATYENGRSLRADCVSRRTIPRIQRYARAAGLANGTINQITHGALPAMFRDCEEEGLIPRGLHAQVLEVLRNKKRLRVPKFDQERALTIEERDHVLAVAREDEHAIGYFSTLFLTGMRPGEACGLRQRSVDWKRRLCKVIYSRSYEDIDETKTEESERIVQLPRAGVAAPSRYRFDGCPDDPLLTSKRGRPIDQNNFRTRYWNPIAARAGFPDLTPHHARHTFATNCLERGVYPAPLAAYLGHSVDVLLERYGHVLARFDIDEAVHAPKIGTIRKIGGVRVADLGF